jgi:hypothetical protein
MAIMKTCRACGKVFRATYRGGPEAKRLQIDCSRECSNVFKCSPEGIAERFWSKVDRSGGEDACWPWLAGKDKDGYGKFSYGPHPDGSGVHQEHVRSHRFALATVGDVPAVMLVLHSCNNPPCCNPRHLRAGTALENVRDCIDADRKSRGLKSALAKASTNKLTPDTVREIRAARRGGEHPDQIAARYGIHPQHVRRVARGARWAEVA